MGCDIHIVVEQKHADVWYVVSNLECLGKSSSTNSRGGLTHLWPLARRRNYGRFAALAGVRGDGPEPLGIPEDVSASGLFLYNRFGEGHSASYMEASAAARLFLETEYAGLLEHMTDYEKEDPLETYFGIYSDEPGEYRIIFWFDN